MSPLMARLVERGSNHQPVSPSVKTVEVLQPRQVPPDVDQRALDGILGGVQVAQDPMRDSEQRTGEMVDQELVRLLVTVPCPFHQTSVHWTSSSRVTADGGRSSMKARPPSVSFNFQRGSSAFSRILSLRG
jgi:hypothetical protein